MRDWSGSRTVSARLGSFETIVMFGNNFGLVGSADGARRYLRRMAGQVRLRVRYLNHATAWIDYLLVSQEEMDRLTRGGGWHVDRFIRSSVVCPRRSTGHPSYVAILAR
jgi:hypothetical protein